MLYDHPVRLTLAALLGFIAGELGRDREPVRRSSQSSKRDMLVVGPGLEAGEVVRNGQISNIFGSRY